MADLVQTRANVKLISGFPQIITAGVNLLQGEVIRDSGGQAVKSLNDTLDNSQIIGIALTPASTGQPVVYAPAGAVVDVGATLAPTELYIVSGTAGAIAPLADLAQADFLNVILVGVTSTTGKIVSVQSGVAKP